MHDETIPAPLMHREMRPEPEPVSSSGLIIKIVAAGLIALFVVGPLLK